MNFSEDGYNNCSGAFINPDFSVRLFSLITYILLFIFGTTFNIVSLWIFCCKLPKWTETTVLLVNLMVADILIVLTFPFRIYSLLYVWDLGPALCRTLTIFYFVNTYISIFTISVIAFDRYLAINNPLKYKGCMSPRKAAVTCCLLWTFCIAVGVLRMILSKVESLNICFVKSNSEPNRLNVALSVIGFFLPLIFISFCSGKVLKNLSVEVPQDSKKQATFRKAMNIITSNLVIFVVCFLPLHVGYIIRFASESNHASCDILKPISIFMHVAAIIANANCVLDTVCYYFAATEFRNALSEKNHIFPKCSSPCCEVK